MIFLILDCITILFGSWFIVFSSNYSIDLFHQVVSIDSIYLDSLFHNILFEMINVSVICLFLEWQVVSKSWEVTKINILFHNQFWTIKMYIDLVTLSQMSIVIC